MKIHINKDYQPYFKEYIKQNNLYDGDEVNNWEYIAWISSKHREYKNISGKDYYEKEEFYKWLKEVI